MEIGPNVLIRVVVVLPHAQDPKLLLQHMAVMNVKAQQQKQENATLMNVQVKSILRVLEDLQLDICCVIYIVDCEWDEFTEWTNCTKGCGGGKQERVREKKIESQFGGMECKGLALEQRDCNTHQCLGLQFA